MADLFALIFFVRQLDELGDPVRGEEVLRSKGCSECHSTDASEDGVGPDLAKWGKYANPIVWAQMMWEHAPMMEQAMKQSDMNWPKLEGSDLVHIVAYVRSAGTSGDMSYLKPGAAARGQRLFLEKQCDSCHPGQGAGPDLAVAELPGSMASLASRMWNHSPTMARVMREQQVTRQPLGPQELADILAYLLALGNQDRGGDPLRGRQVFDQKGCTQCHERGETADSAGPSLSQLGADATPVRMATAMWNHGETMLERMTEAGISWPVFDDNEMVDLLAFLRSDESSPDSDP
jgi:cytochrome c2